MNNNLEKLDKFYESFNVQDFISAKDVGLTLLEDFVEDSNETVSKFLHKLGIVLNNTKEFDFAKKVLLRAIKINEKLESYIELAENHSEVAFLFSKKLDFENSLLYYQNSIEYRKILNDETGIAVTYGNIGVTYFLMSDFDNARVFVEKSLSIFESLGMKSSIAKQNTTLGGINRNTSNYSQAVECYQKAIDIYSELEDFSQMAQTIGNLGLLYYFLSEYDKALKLFEQALSLAYQINDKEAIAHNLTNIGNVFYNLYDNDNAKEYYKKALQLHIENNDKYNESITLGNIGGVYLQKMDFQNAILCFRNALQIAEENNIKYSIALHNSSLGLTNSLLSNFETAIEYFLKSISINIEINVKFGLVSDYKYLGELYSKINQYDLAFEYLTNSLQLSIEIQDKFNQMECLIRLTNLYEILGDFEKAFLFHKRYVEIKDEIQSEETINKAKMLDHRRKIEDSERDRQIKLARFQEQERLLHDILPLEIANRIIQGETTIAEQNENVSLFFSDIVGFTTISQTIEPDLLVHELNIIFQEYDRIAKQYSIEKIKTIGDAYMAVSGINESIEHPHYNIAMFAIDVIDRLKKLELGRNKFKIRVGLHVGKVISGVIGGYKFSYDIWGDTVNIASRMESHSEPGRIHITEQFAKSIEHYPEFSVITRGEITVKGKGTMKTYWLEKKK